MAYGENNKANEYKTISSNGVSHNVRYDDAGNLVHDENALGYGYDAENRMTRVFSDANTNGVYDGGDTLLVEYAYDALGRRVEKTDHTAQGGSQVTRYVYDFHEPPSSWIPGVPYRIIWTWTTRGYARYEKKCDGTERSTLPPPFSGVGGSW